MSRDQAHTLLNLAKQGGSVSRIEILEALMMTGDLAPGRITYQTGEVEALPAPIESTLNVDDFE